MNAYNLIEKIKPYQYGITNFESRLTPNLMNKK